MTLGLAAALVVSWRRASPFFPLLFLVLGIAQVFLFHGSLDNGALPRLALAGVEVEVSGRSLSPPSNGGSFFMETRTARNCDSSWKTRERLMVAPRVRSQANPVVTGSQVKARGTLTFNPDKRCWLRERGAACVMAAAEIELVDVVPESTAAIPSRCRNWAQRNIRAVFDEKYAPLIEGLTTGDRRNLPPRLEADLRGCGLSHILAVSGLHVGCAALFASLFARKLGGGRRSVFLAALLAAAAVMVMADFRPSAVRAFIMGVICFAGAASGRRYDIVCALCVAGIVILCINPRSVFDRGFIMSFAAVAGIIAFADRGTPSVARKGAVAVTAGSQLALVPALLAMGEGVPVTSLAANAIAIPLMAPALSMSWLSVMAGSVSNTAGRLLACMAVLPVRIIVGISSVLSRVPRAGPSGGWLGAVCVAVYVAGLVWLYRETGRDGRLWRPATAIVLAIVLSLLRVAVPAVTGSGRGVIVLDVGQGDSILLLGKDGSSALVDGGPDPSRLLSELESRGVGKIDLVVLTHPHMDHAGGLRGVLGRLSVGRLLVSSVEPGTVTGDLVSVSLSKGIEVDTAREGDRLQIGGSISIEILHATACPPDETENLNDCSIVLMVDVDGLRALLTGDLEAEGQKRLIGLHPSLGCDLLKVPHQGARDAACPALLDSCRPSIAAVSVGEGNRYGHPSEAYLRMLETRGVRVLRTDQNGDIEVYRSDGRIFVSVERR